MRSDHFRNILFFFCSAVACLLHTVPLSAGPGDTIKVQTFTFGSPQEGWFVMPGDTMRFEKIYMLYKLKCNPNQNPACGEWDYLTYTYQYQPVMDSFVLNAANFEVNGLTPDSFAYLKNPAVQYYPSVTYFPVYTDTLSYAAFESGNANTAFAFPFHTTAPVSRSQFLWTAAELTALGMTAGDITGLQFYVDSTGGSIANLSLRLNNSNLDSLTQNTLEAGGFTEVFKGTLPAADTGWYSFPFLNSFAWDGVSNVVLEVACENDIATADWLMAAETQAEPVGVSSYTVSHEVHFNDANYISVPKEAFASVDSQITVAFWFRGDPFLEDRTTFEAYNTYGYRMLNVHLPWSNSNIYWDAGCEFIGGYDRINKQAAITDYENEWHHYAFTKNAAEGTMKIFKDGSLWHSGTGLHRTMKDINKFWIGAALWNSSVAANGAIDEFAVWNRELDSATLQQYMYKGLDEAHPFHANLLVYFPFHGDDPFVVKDESGNGFDGSVIGAQIRLPSSAELFFDVQSLPARPLIRFEKGVYTTIIDSVVSIDSSVLTASTLVLFDDLLHPQLPTDSLLAWKPYFRHVYDAAGHLTDSVYVAADTVLHKTLTPYHTGPVPSLRRWELGRYITPYGIGLSLGDGWTWTYDVSDYSMLLRDSVYLTAGNWQEYLDLQFLFIEGTPPRDPLNIQNLWVGDYGWNSSTNDVLAPTKVLIPDSISQARVKLRITGHGADQFNCAEFCENTAYLKVNGSPQFERSIWRSDCALNPLYPQGGTWIFQRANWCPGAEVTTFDWDISPLITSGDSAELDLDLEYYAGSTSGWANYVTETQLITYGPPNYSLDAEVYDIISPSNNQMYKRRNPVCNNPLIVIRNNGTTPLTSATITYGREGAPASVYEWTGNLPFLDTAHVRLGAFLQPDQSNSSRFTAAISNPNGGNDENANNDAASTEFTFPPQYPPHLVVELKTNYRPGDNAYTITDDQGNVVLSKSGFASNAVHKDTIVLPDGCYTFRLTDSGEDGLYFWFYPSFGSGYLRLRNADANSAIVKSFGADFGAEVYHEFTVGYYVNTPDPQPANHFEVSVYPNPAGDETIIDVALTERSDAVIVLTDLAGKEIFRTAFRDILNETFPVDLRRQPTGIYLLHVTAGGEKATKKIVVSR